MAEDMKMQDGMDVVAEEVKAEIVETKKGFHPIQAIKAGIEKHPKVAKVIGGVAIAATATVTTLAVLGKRKGSDLDSWDGYGSDEDDGETLENFFVDNGNSSSSEG